MPLWLKDDCFCQDVFAVRYFDSIFWDHALVLVLFGRASLELKEFYRLKKLERTMAFSESSNSFHDQTVNSFLGTLPLHALLLGLFASPFATSKLTKRTG